MSGAELIAAERRRQIEAEGFTAEHDDRQDDGELRYAALCYAINGNPGSPPPDLWPWESKW
jgi:hypothetical protein